MQDEVMIDIDNPKDDCISRAYLKDCIHEETHYTGHDILSLLETLPSVQPKPKAGHWKYTGHWIYDRTRDWDGECKYECSECGFNSIARYSYCPNCGAKMESEG